VNQPPKKRQQPVPDNARDVTIFAVAIFVFVILIGGLVLHRWTAAVGGAFGGAVYVLYAGRRNIRQRLADGRPSEWRWR
jgi:membrane associated rhomboid family serine protease